MPMLSAIYAECRNQAHYADCCNQAHYAECRYAEWHYAECHYSECRSAVYCIFSVILFIYLTF